MRWVDGWAGGRGREKHGRMGVPERGKVGRGGEAVAVGGVRSGISLYFFYSLSLLFVLLCFVVSSYCFLLSSRCVHCVV